MFSLLEIAAVAILSFFMVKGGNRVEQATDEQRAAVVEQERVNVTRGGGSDPIVTNAKEMELVSRGVQLPSRGSYVNDPASYEAELNARLIESAGSALAYTPTGPKKFEVAVPIPGASGTTMLDMINFERPKETALPPPEIEHWDC